MQRVTITMPDDVLEEVRRRVADGRARNVSSYISSLVEESVRTDGLLELLDELDAEEGPPSEEAQRWGRELFRRLG